MKIRDVMTPNPRTVSPNDTVQSAAQVMRTEDTGVVPVVENGRVLAMGYEGHVASHGLDWAPRKEAVEKILNGKPGWSETAQQLRVRYLFWGREEEENYPDSPQPWMTDY